LIDVFPVDSNNNTFGCCEDRIYTGPTSSQQVNLRVSLGPWAVLTAFDGDFDGGVMVLGPWTLNVFNGLGEFYYRVSFDR
jgi:hypothetical protein